MDLNKILKEMGDKTDKSWTYLKGLFNTANAEYEDKFGDALSDERKMSMALVKVGKKYGLDKETIEAMFDDDIIDDDDIDNEDIEDDYIPSDEDLQIAKDIEGMIDEESTLKITDDPNHGIDPKTGKVDVSSGSPSAWKRFLASIPDPTLSRKEYTKLPSLIIEIGATYYLKMTDVTQEIPEGREFEGKWGPYVLFPLKVTLIKVSDGELYGVKYDSGDFKGKLAFVNGQDYTLWLNEKSIGFFALFWDSVTDDGTPDNRVFMYKYTKKGKYNVYKYKLKK